MAIDNSFLVKKIVSAGKIFCLFSRATHHPFAICDEETFDDQMMFFESEEAMKEAAGPWMKKGYPVYGVGVLPQEMKKFFMDSFALGFNGIGYFQGEDKTNLSLDDFIKTPDFTQLPENKRPILNQSLQMSAMYFIQELSRQVPADQKDNLQELEEELAANLAKARLMIPVHMKEGHTINPGDKLEPGTFDLTFVKDKDGNTFIPAFADVPEFLIFNRENKFQGITMEIDKIRVLVKGDIKGMIFNPNTMALKLTPKMLDGILKRFFDFE